MTHIIYQECKCLRSNIKGMQPLCKYSCLATCSFLVTVKIGHRGRYLEIRCEDLPVFVSTTIACAKIFIDASTADNAVDSETLTGNFNLKIKRINEQLD